MVKIDTRQPQVEFSRLQESDRATALRLQESDRTQIQLKKVELKATKKDKILSFAATCMDLGIIILSEVSQRKTKTI